MAEQVFIVLNVSKSASTKIRRFIEPGRARQKQFLGPYRVLHNQQLRLSPDEYKKHEDSILERVRRGIFRVTTPDGEMIYADPQGNLKSRKGQEIRDLVYTAPAAPPVPEPQAAPVIAASIAPPPAPHEVSNFPETDVSNAYQEVAPPQEETSPKQEEMSVSDLESAEASEPPDEAEPEKRSHHKQPKGKRR